MKSKSINNLFNFKKKELEDLEKIINKYPHLKVDFIWSGPIYFSEDANSLVDNFEKIDCCHYQMYFTDETGIRIYSNPHTIEVKSLDDYELEWLDPVINCNPKILLKIMKEIHSMYLNSSYYDYRYPDLNKWRKLYNIDI